MPEPRLIDSRSGYTLAETLVALAVLAMVSAGVVSAGRVIVREQAAAAETGRSAADLLRLRAGLAALVPWSADPELPPLSGDRAGLTGSCLAPCSAVIGHRNGRPVIAFRDQASIREVLLPGEGFRFSYVTAARAGFERWPSGRTGDADARDPLQAIRLENGAVVVSLPIAAQLHPDCLYDLVTRECRPWPVA